MEHRAGSKWSRYTGLFAAVACVASTPLRASVVVEGVDAEIGANVIAVMRLDDEPCDAPRRRVEQAFAAAPAEIQIALEAFGHYAPEITRSLRFEPDCWVAQFDITPGEVVMLRRVEVAVTGDASGDRAFTNLLVESALEPNTPLNHSRYEALKSALTTLALERGYADARFAQARIDIYPAELAADVELVFASGTRYRFGQISLDQSILNDDFILAYLGFASGDYYDTRRLAQARLDLINSGYFNTVDIRPLQADPERARIPIVITLSPAPKRSIGYGVGVSTDTGARVRFSRNIRRFNEAGHQLNFNSMLSPVITEVSANYRMPYGDPRREWVSFDAGINREATDTATSESLQFGARRVLQSESGWGRTQFLTLLIEDFEVGDQIGRARLLMPGTEFSRLRADNAVRPRRGSKLVLEARGARDGFGSDTSFVQIVGRGKWIWGLPRASRLLVRTDVGRTWVDQVIQLPPSVRFFAGGDNSVRGYDFETLGPTNAAGEVIGGSRLLTASVELEYSIKRAWSIAAFVDAGNAFDGSSPRLQRGVGIGARWQSPLGPIRIDIAKPQHGIDRDLRLHISLGPDL